MTLGINYLLSYKMSQDHLELLFGVIRGQGGFSDNPTKRIFTSIYKKLLMSNEVYII